MSVSDQMAEASISTLLIDSLESTQNGGALSADDLAWADSCFVKDAEISDGDWSSVKDALLEILSLQPEPRESIAPESDSFLAVNDTGMMITFNEAGFVNSFGGGMDDDSIPMNEEGEANTDDIEVETGIWSSQQDIKKIHSTKAGNEESLGGGMIDEAIPMNEERKMILDGFKEETGLMLSQVLEADVSETSLKNPFLPNYKEEDNERVSVPVDAGLDAGFASYEMEPPSTDDIFKIWDLNIPTEEDEFAKLLNKALTESSVQSTPSKVDVSVSGALGDLKEVSLDNLISAMEGLSIARQPS